MTTADTGAPPHERRGPGRPRSARADEAIIDAVLSLLAEGTTAESLSIEAVAGRAGVGKATIYRRWANKESLLVDAVATLKGAPPALRGESVREDLLTLMRPVTGSELLRSRQITNAILVELHRNQELHGCFLRMVAPRREVMREVLRRGGRTGELRADLDLDVVVAMLMTPLLAQSMLRWNPALDTEDLPERLLDTVWPAIAATDADPTDADPTDADPTDADPTG